MLYLNQDAHWFFLSRELKLLLSDDSFASRLRRRIGEELHYRFFEWSETETEYSRFYPVDTLFYWILENGGLDPEWLSTEDGIYHDDEGSVIPENIEPIYSGVEQLAAYGWWLMHDSSAPYGSIPDQGMNDHGVTREQFIEHQTECMLLAYQALFYAQRLMLNAKLTIEETEKASKFDFSELGKRGASKRHEAMGKLRAWTIEQYQGNTWASANQAAHDLMDRVIEKGRALGAHLTKANAQRTIADWIRKWNAKSV